jgi:hypothetical protein
MLGFVATEWNDGGVEAWETGAGDAGPVANRATAPHCVLPGGSTPSCIASVDVESLHRQLIRWTL